MSALKSEQKKKNVNKSLSEKENFSTNTIRYFVTKTPTEIGERYINDYSLIS